VSAAKILSLITQTSHIHGSLKGQEERDMLFARLFGITSLVQSGILFRSTTPASTLQDFQSAMGIILALPAKKAFLREPAYWAFILSLHALGASHVEWKSEAWVWVAETVFTEDAAWSPEKVGVALSLQKLGVDLDWKEYTSPTFKSGDILSSGSLSTLAKILRVEKLFRCITTADV
jgi:DNA polymerase phi